MLRIGKRRAAGRWVEPLERRALLSGTPVAFTVPADAEPWAAESVNPNYTFGLGNGAAPTVVDATSGVTITPGQAVTIQYQSGLASFNYGGQVDATGVANSSGLSGAGVGGTGDHLPSLYVSPADYPAYIGCLIGAFTDGTGTIVGVPFYVGNGRTVTAPAGANQLQLGTNDDDFSDDAGSWTVSVTADAGTPSAVALTAGPTLTADGTGDTFTAKVTAPGGGGAPTGTVAFAANGTVLGTAPVAADGTATLTTASVVPAATATGVAYTVVYSGDTTFALSTGGAPRFTVPATAQPWVVGTTNPDFSYGQSNGTAPVVVDAASGLPIMPGESVAISYLSGSASYNGGNGDADGVVGSPYSNTFSNEFGELASDRISPGDFPAYIACMIGDFTDANGVLVGIPFKVGDAHTVSVPAGATQLQLGVNDNKYDDNSGSWQVTVAIADPATVGDVPSTVALAGPPTEAFFGDSATLTAHVTGTAGGPVPTGTVGFAVNGDVFATAPVDATGTATLSATNLPAGAADYTVAYTGDATYAASTVAAASLTPVQANASVLVPTIARSTVPTSVVAGQRVKGTVTVTVTNSGTTTLAGADKVTLYATQDASATIDSGSTAVASTTHKLKLAAGRSLTLRLPVLLDTTGDDGSFPLRVLVTDAAGNASASAAVPLAIAPATVTLAATVAAATPTAVQPGQTVHFTLTVTNSGNVDSTGDRHRLHRPDRRPDHGGRGRPHDPPRRPRQGRRPAGRPAAVDPRPQGHRRRHVLPVRQLRPGQPDARRHRRRARHRRLRAPAEPVRSTATGPPRPARHFSV